MRERNWSEYNKQLVQRGSLTFLIDPKMIKELKVSTTKAKARAGRPQEFSNRLIELLAIIKVHFKMAYRFLEGFAKSFLIKFFPGLKLPTYSLICSRVATIELPTLPLSQGETIVLDSTGMKVTGEGEWKVKIHGRGRPRKWVKVHLGIELESQKIVAEIVTDSSIGDSKMTRPLLAQVQGKIKKVIADGVDMIGVRLGRRYERKKAQALIPPPKNAKYRGLKNERDRAILEIHGLGNSKEGRSLWGKLTGYNQRVLVEAAISRLKRLFGDRFYSKSLERQMVENRLRCLLINRMCHG